MRRRRRKRLELGLLNAGAVLGATITVCASLVTIVLLCSGADGASVSREELSDHAAHSAAPYGIAALSDEDFVAPIVLGILWVTVGGQLLYVMLRAIRNMESEW